MKKIRRETIWVQNHRLKKREEKAKKIVKDLNLAVVKLKQLYQSTTKKFQVKGKK